MVHPTCGPTQEDDIPGIVRYKTYTVLKEHHTHTPPTRHPHASSTPPPRSPGAFQHDSYRMCAAVQEQLNDDRVRWVRTLEAPANRIVAATFWWQGASSGLSSLTLEYRASVVALVKIRLISLSHGPFLKFQNCLRNGRRLDWHGTDRIQRLCSDWLV